MPVFQWMSCGGNEATGRLVLYPSRYQRSGKVPWCLISRIDHTIQLYLESDNYQNHYWISPLLSIFIVSDADKSPKGPPVTSPFLLIQRGKITQGGGGNCLDIKLWYCDRLCWFSPIKYLDIQTLTLAADGGLFKSLKYLPLSPFFCVIVSQLTCLVFFMLVRILSNWIFHLIKGAI